jgi:uncharacterized Ntn-hydrolase superfamily protein
VTFSLVVRDTQTGSFGSVICSSSPAVGARCVHLRDGVGAVHSQNVTDPRLGPATLDLIAEGSTAEEAIAKIVTETPAADFRQLVAIDTAGRTAIHSGAKSLGVVSDYMSPGAAAAGNLLATADVPRRLVEGWLSASGTIEQRLLAALHAARNEGGEAGPVHSAALSVVSGHGWRTTDLRVDWSDDPISDLSALLDIWLPQRDDYVLRGEDPARSPGYGVPGDAR